MKRAVILHGTDGSPAENWFPWLEIELTARGYDVWAPQLPDSHTPNAKKYTEFLLGAYSARGRTSSGVGARGPSSSTRAWDFRDNLLVGHSSGGVEILNLLQHLPDGVRVKTAVLAGAFSDNLADDPDWVRLKGLFEEPFDYTKIKSRSDNFLFVHGSDDPWCPLEGARYLAEETSGELVVVEGGQHFSTSLDPSYTTFPKLVELLEERELL